MRARDVRSDEQRQSCDSGSGSGLGPDHPGSFVTCGQVGISRHRHYHHRCWRGVESWWRWRRGWRLGTSHAGKLGWRTSTKCKFFSLSSAPSFIYSIFFSRPTSFLTKPFNTLRCSTYCYGTCLVSMFEFSWLCNPTPLSPAADCSCPHWAIRVMHPAPVPLLPHRCWRHDRRDEVWMGTRGQQSFGLSGVRRGRRFRSGRRCMDYGRVGRLRQRWARSNATQRSISSPWCRQLGWCTLANCTFFSLSSALYFI